MRGGVVETTQACFRGGRGWLSPPPPLLTSPVGTSNHPTAENQGTFPRFPARRRARVGKASRQRKYQLHTCRHKTRGRNAECAGIPDPAPHRARSFQQNKL